MTTPIFFEHEGSLWDWYESQGKQQRELWVGLYKKGSGMPTVSIRETMDAALCWGWSESKWIKLDTQRFCIRFTPRIPAKPWSANTAKRFAVLAAEGVVQPPGLQAWDLRDVTRTELELSKAAARKKD